MKTICKLLLYYFIVVIFGCSSEDKKHVVGFDNSNMGQNPASEQEITEPHADQYRNTNLEATLKNYYCDESSNCSSTNSVLVAQNQREAAWLLRYGYPSNDQLDKLQSASDAQLLQLINRGSASAMTVYGLRAINEGNMARGMSALKKAIDTGSIYAYYGLSEAYMSKGNPNASVIDAVAYIRLAYLLGDYKASEYMQLKFPNLHKLELVAAEKRASGLYQTLAKNMRPAPRPME